MRNCAQRPHGKKSLDDVARRLAGARGEVTLAGLQKIAQEVAGRPLRTLERDQLMKTELTPVARSR